MARSREMPQKPGYYWAKWQIAADGTVEGDELTPAVNWEIVQVNSNVADWMDVSDEDEPERLSVAVCGIQMTQWRDCFVWGEFVSPLERPIARPSPDLIDALVMALPYVEVCEADPAYKAQHVKNAVKQIRAALAKASPQDNGE